MTLADTQIKNLAVVPTACRFAADRSSGVIVIESTRKKPTEFSQAITELQSVDARHLALGYAAQQGVADPRVNGNVNSPYGVNGDGESLDDAQAKYADQPLNHPKRQPVSYRIEVPVTRKLV